MDPLTIGFVALLLAIVVSRMLAERAYRVLSDDEKLRLMDGFSTFRTYSTLPALAIVLLMFGLPPVLPGSEAWIGVGGIGLLVVVSIVLHFVVVRILGRLNLPPRYVRGYLVSRHVAHLGLAALVGCTLLGPWLSR
jgi:hypothetical protein